MSKKTKKQPNMALPDGDRPVKSSDVIRFKQEETPEERQLSRRDRTYLIISAIALIVLVAALITIWVIRDRFSSDDFTVNNPRSAASAPKADDEYLFDTSTGQTFASVGRGLAIASGSGLELLDGDGQLVASQLFQMVDPAITSCADYAVFYDLGGTGIYAAFLDGTVRELTAAGRIFSATVSSGGYLTVVTECSGYRGLVTVYDATLKEVYMWYSSSAWIISAEVSPDNRSLAVLSYTSSGSEVRLFSLSSEEQQAAFSVSDTILLDAHWFTSSQLCAYSSGEAFFFGSDGKWTNTYSFDGKYLVGCAFGEGFVTFALSPYRSGTTATLVSLDIGGRELGSADVQSELISLVASGTEVLSLCPDSATLYSSSLAEKGRLTGLTGFKCGLIRSRGEALLISSGFAEIHTF